MKCFIVKYVLTLTVRNTKLYIVIIKYNTVPRCTVNIKHSSRELYFNRFITLNIVKLEKLKPRKISHGQKNLPKSLQHILVLLNYTMLYLETKQK